MAKRRKDGYIRRSVKLSGMDKPKYFYGKTDAEVTRKIAAWTQEREKGRLFKDVAEGWENVHFETLQNGTKMCYNPAYKRAVSEFGDIYIKDVTPQEIKTALDRMAKQGYSAQSVKVFKTVLNLIFNHAILNKELVNTPLAAVKLPRNMPKEQRKPPTDAEIEIVKSSYDVEFGLFAYLLLYTGCRRGEALALQWKDIDIDNRTITISKTLNFVNNKPLIKHFTKTKAGLRDIILLKLLADKLQPGKPSDYIFKEMQTERAFRYKWDKYCRTVGIKITPHQLRHAYATTLYEADIDEKAAQSLMGHADISTTRDVYTHIRQSKIKSVEDKLNDFVGK